MKTTIAALAVLALGVAPALALDGPGRALALSDTELQISNDPLLNGLQGSSIRRSFVLPYSGVVRVKWEVRSGNGNEVTSAVAVQHLSECARPTKSAAFIEKSCNIRVKDGMPVVISASPTDNDNTVSLRNVRIYYRVIDSRGETINYQPPVLR